MRSWALTMWFLRSLVPSPGLKTWQTGLRLLMILCPKVCVWQNATVEGSPQTLAE